VIHRRAAERRAAEERDAAAQRAAAALTALLSAFARGDGSPPQI
jgi:hypothetical protein